MSRASSDAAAEPSPSVPRGLLWSVLLWSGLAFAFAPTLGEAFRNLVQQPWTRATLVFPLLAYMAARAERPSEPSRSGWALIGVGIVIQQIAISGEVDRAGKIGFILAAIGLCRWAGWCSLETASLLAFLIPLPHVVVAFGSPWLEGGLATGAALLARSLGFAVDYGSGALVSEGATLRLADRDGGLGLVVLLAGLAWFDWLCRPERRSGRLALLALTGIVAAGAIQLASLTGSAMMLAVRGEDSAGVVRAWLDRIPWLLAWTSGVALAWIHRRAEGTGARNPISVGGPS